MIDEATVGIGLAVDIVNSIERILKTFVYTDPVAFGLVRLIMECYCLIHLRLLIDVS